MKIYLGLLEGLLPHQTRLFTDVDGKLIDLTLAYSAYLAQDAETHPSAYELAAYCFPSTVAAFLERGEQSLKALEEAVSFAGKSGIGEMRGPAGEKVAYDPTEIRILPPFQNPERSFVIGFSDQARVEAMPKAEIPTGFYKLPQTFVTTGAPIVLAEILRGSRRRCLPRHRDRQSRKESSARPGLGSHRGHYPPNRHHGARHQPAGRHDDQQLARQEFPFQHFARTGDATEADAKRVGSH